MDFLMAFVIYLFALSLFFFVMKESVADEGRGMDVPGELVLSKLAATWDFMQGARVSPAGLDAYVAATTPEERYAFLFKDYEDFGRYTRMDYCITLEGPTGIVRNFAAYADPAGYPIRITTAMNPPLCGANPSLAFGAGPIARCLGGDTEAVALARPVVFGTELLTLKVLACGTRR